MNQALSIIGLIVQMIGLILFEFYGWVVIVGILGYMIWQNNRKKNWVQDSDNILLLIEVPKDNDKKELSAEQMFASLHGILRPRKELIKDGALQEHISLEIASVGNQIQFYVWTPRHLKDFVEGQIYAQYPRVHIKEGVEDYARSEIGERVVFGTEMGLDKIDVLPIKTFVSFEVDPLAGITAVLSKLGQSGEEMWIQILARPIDDSWQDKGHKFIEAIKAGKQPGLGRDFLQAALQLPTYIITNFFNGLVAPPETKKPEEKKEVKLSTGQQALIKAVEEKTTKLGYEIKVRVAYLGPDKELARQRLQAVVGAFKQFNTTNLNGFSAGHYTDSDELINDYRARLFLGSGSIVNIEELASVYHLPHTSVETPNMVWNNTKTGEAPSNLPTPENTENEDLSLFGITNFRGTNQKFGIKRLDRGRHLYIVGQTGTGKSGLLQLLTLSDIYHDMGFAVIDPHGDYATEVMQYIPESRVKDVIYFNPADREFPIAFNPLEVSDPSLKNHIASELVGVLQRLFGAISWGPRLEYILRYTIMALLDYPNATMLGITRMLSEKEFRKKVIKEIEDPVVRNFWVHEFASWNDKFASEAVAPVLNKVGAFVANPIVRNVIGQPKSTIDLRKVMDEGKILIVNLSRGQVGEDNAAILGALMVTKIQLAAMGRANVPKEQRRPFYLYVDEFQNFATDSFAVILSEARKYGLNLTVANQYVAQMPDTVKDAVFGNVGSMITFRVGADDARYLARYFAPTFEEDDLVKINNRNMFINMSIDGEKATAFSARSLSLPDPQEDHTPAIVEQTRAHFSRPRDEVEKEIHSWADDTDEKPANLTHLKESSTKPSHEQKANTFLGSLKNPDKPKYAYPAKKEKAGEHQAGHKSTDKHHKVVGAQEARPEPIRAKNERDLPADEPVNLR